MRKKRRIRRKIGSILILLAVCVCVAVRGIGQRGTDDADREADHVSREELAGYLAVIPLSPEETRKLILPDIGSGNLRGTDLPVLLDKLGLSAYTEEITAAAVPLTDKPLDRAVWTKVYEALLERLGVRDQVAEAEIQYLGDLSGEERIVADSGHYDCDTESCRFTYGKTYRVYLYGNFILGMKEEAEKDEVMDNEPQPAAQEAGDGAAAQETGQAAGDQTGRIAVPDTVRVLLTQDNQRGAYRRDVRVKSGAGLTVTGGEQTLQAGKDETVDCGSLMDQWGTDSLEIRPGEGGRLYLADSSGKTVTAGYRGMFRVRRAGSGLWVVNELSMEEYLYGVVPGEMPEKFAPEALKAQAVCARTYVCRQIAGKRFEEFSADVNDTTDCQVYMTSGENEKACQAVDATAGQVLAADGELAATYYFSTSCGYTSGREVWNEDGVGYLKTVSLLTEPGESVPFEDFIKDTDAAAYDSESRFFRWTAKADLSGRSKAIKNRLNTYLKEKNESVQVAGKTGMAQSDCKGLGTCTGIAVKKRADSGTVTDLELQFSGGNAHIRHENIIRTVLGDAVVSVTDKNGKTAKGSQMLPSAAFAAENGKKGVCVLYGGGFGHGIGMSQYGADGMARAGMSCMEILQTFFPGTSVSGG